MRSPRHVAAIRRPYMALRHRGIDPSDAILLSYPKSGNTWLKFLLIHLATGKSGDFDTSDALVPYVGEHTSAPRLLPDGGRLIKSHESCGGLYRRHYRRVLLIVRDGRDVAVSYHHALIRRRRWRGDFSSFLTAFLAGQLDGYGAWQDHVCGWLDALESRPDSLLVLHYEAMLRDPVEQLGMVARFLRLRDERERLEEAVAANVAAEMRTREVASARYGGDVGRGHVVRKATAGEWRSAFSPADLDRFLEAAGPALGRLGYPMNGLESAGA